MLTARFFRLVLARRVVDGRPVAPADLRAASAAAWCSCGLGAGAGMGMDCWRCGIGGGAALVAVRRCGRVATVAARQRWRRGN
eukprot:3669066-Prymnesium_polylepis.1